MTDIDAEDDQWMAIDLAVWRDLLSEADDATWFTAVPLEDVAWKNIIGDPQSERLQFAETARAGTTTQVADIDYLKTSFTSALAEVAITASPQDALVVVICGHGEEYTGKVSIGVDERREWLAKEEVEVALRRLVIPQQCTDLISTACYAGVWRSDRWTLFGGADYNQTSMAMSTSGSGENRGGVFTYAIVAERADEYGLTVPYPVAMIYDHETDFNKVNYVAQSDPVVANLSYSTALLESPRRSTSQAHQFMETLRARIGGLYNDANFVLCPPSDLPSTFPLRPFTAKYQDRFCVVGPSPRSYGTEVRHVGEAERKDAPDPPALTPAEAKDLFRLATEFSRYEHASAAIDVSINAQSRMIATHRSLRTPAKERILLAKLRYRDRACRRASAIAEFLRWETAWPVEEWVHANGLERMLEAEAAGAAIAAEFFSAKAEGACMGKGQRVWRTMGPGAWLAEAWVGAGRPEVVVVGKFGSDFRFELEPN
ncbi:hypothetical protein B0H10DRAFT_2333844 [Mycena sp. CBHHK59/15]|nr:hypothetical protein B0H10DRAFT_2333844 [Mycena sp. CBHHK59/15]